MGKHAKKKTVKVAKPVDPCEQILGITPVEASELWETLTPKEKEVAAEIAKDDKNKNIAARLNISPKTLDIHRANVKRKLKANGPSRIAAVALLRQTETIQFRQPQPV